MSRSKEVPFKLRTVEIRCCMADVGEGSLALILGRTSICPLDDSLHIPLTATSQVLHGKTDKCLDLVEVVDLVIGNEGQRLADDSFLAVGALVVAYYRMECDGCMVPVHTLDLSLILAGVILSEVEHLNNSILGRVFADCRELLLLPRCRE